MAERRFNLGDVVRLKSGGPKMTVVKYGTFPYHGEGEMVQCKWFDEKNKPAYELFAEAELETAPSDSGSVTLRRA